MHDYTHPMSISLYIIIGVNVGVSQAWTCPDNSSKVFVRQIQEAELRFQVNLSALSTALSYKIWTPASVSLLTISYFQGIVFGRLYINDTYCTFTGSAETGQLTVLLKEGNPPGVYRLGESSATEKCIDVFILGIPSTPQISKNKDPSVGESVTLTCSSSSTTIFSNHSLSLGYTWRVDGANNPNSSRYTYSASQSTVTLSNVVKLDNDKQFTCFATEQISNGYTSDSSKILSLVVLYGPENVSLLPSNASYEMEENAQLPAVTCIADCNPLCSFAWTKRDSVEEVSHTVSLQLGMLQASYAGTYRCTATWASSFVFKELTVSVIYGPYQESTSLIPQKSEYLVNEGESLADITCHANCYPDCTYTWTKERNGSVPEIIRQATIGLGTVARTDAAVYTCEAVNPRKIKSSTTRAAVKIAVHYGPDTCEKLRSTYTYTEGEMVPDIRCPADCYPGCTFEWSNEGGIVSSSEVLALGSVSRNQTGNYTYQAHNMEPTYARSTKKTFQVIVRLLPEATLADKQSQTVAAAVGGAVAALVVVFSVVLLVVVVRRRRAGINCWPVIPKETSETHHSKPVQKEENTYCGLMETEVRSVYSDLQISESRTNVYEQLQDSDDQERKQTYSSLRPGDTVPHEHPSEGRGCEKTYVNLDLTKEQH